MRDRLKLVGYAILAMTIALLLQLNQGLAQQVPASTQLIQQGKDLYQAGRFAEAATAWQQASSLDEIQRGDRLKQAQLLNYLSLAYQQLNQWQPANSSIATSLTLLQPCADNSCRGATSAQLLLAQALNTQGSLQLAQGQAEEALKTWQQAAKTYAQANNEMGRLGSLINQAQAQQSLGLYLQARKTLTTVAQALQAQSNVSLQLTGLRSLGNVLRLVGDLDQSRQVLEQSLTIAQKHTSPERSAILLSLGNTARAQRDTPAALSFYQQAATLAATPLIQVQAQLNQLSLLVGTDRQTEIQSQVQPLYAQLSQLPVSRSSIYAHVNLAQTLQRLPNQTTAAAQLLATAVQQSRRLGDRRAESYALGYLAKQYEQTQQWSDAQTVTEQALLIAQTLDAADIAYQWQWQLGRILRVRGNTSAALTAYDGAFKTLNSLRSDLVALNPDVQFSFRDSVEPVYREYVDLLLNNHPNPATLKQARTVIESLQLAELANFFRSTCLEGQTVAIEDIDQTAVAVIYPIILADRLAVILSLPQQPLQYYSTPIAQTQVESTLEQLRQFLEKPFTAPEGRVLGYQVYDWLMRPLEPMLTQSRVQTLVFVLDGALRNVPMAALYDGNQYLVEKYSIALAPGLQLLSPTPVRQIQLQTLAAGLTQERHGFVALEGVDRELKRIQSQVPSKVLVDQAFTSQTLQQQIDSSPYPVVHLATHGQFSSNADETFLLAWDRPIKVHEMRDLLRARQRGRSQPIELLVLSACETAEGDSRAALGLAGMAVQAGARSTLASLWNLDDESGAELASEFYRKLTAGAISKAEALRQTQLSMLKNPDYRHPIHWAPYVLVGNWL